MSLFHYMSLINRKTDCNIASQLPKERGWWWWWAPVFIRGFTRKDACEKNSKIQSFNKRITRGVVINFLKASLQLIA